MSPNNAAYSNRNGQGHKPPTASRPAVLHLTPSLELSHEAREVVDLCVQTHRAGWRPLIASAGGSLVLEAERAAVRHTSVSFRPGNPVTVWRTRTRLEKLIDRERPVLIHAHGLDLVDVASKLATKKNLPLLIDVTEPAPVTPNRRKEIQIAADRGARFRVPSQFMATFLKEEMGLNTQYLYHIWPGVDLQWFDASRVTPERIHALHRLWRLPEQGTVIVMAMPFAPGYGHSLLLEALAEVKNNGVYAVLIGDDRLSPGMRTTLEKQVATLGLEGKVVMPENCTDWPAACWLSSLVVAVNSLPRGQAPELLDAQAVGRPVIVTNVGAHAEMAHQGETAWIIPPDDREALIAALKEALCMSATRRIEMALRTRELMSEYFPMTTWRDSLFNLYGHILSQPALTSNSPSAAA